MSSNWKWKALMVVVSTLLGIYLLVPTLGGFGKIREASETTGTELPAYVKLFPAKVLNLGLDLRGGIYIEMEVDVASAIKRRLDLSSRDIETSLKDKQIPFVSVSQPKDSERLYIVTESSSDRQQIMEIITTDYGRVFQVFETPLTQTVPTVVVGYKEEERVALSASIVEQALETIRNRIDRYGVSEPSITKVGKDRIAIELPGISDPDRAINLIKKTGQLEFKIVNETVNQADLQAMIGEVKTTKNLPDNYTITTVDAINADLKEKIPADTEILFELQRDPVTKKVLRGIPYLLNNKAEVTGDMLENANTTINNNEPAVLLDFDKRGTKLFGDLTANNIKKRLAIVLDGNVMKAPVIQEAIPQGQARITFGFGNYKDTLQEADDLALVLREGALPATMYEVTKTIIGPTLGKDSIDQGVRASLIAAFAVFLFMMVYYKFSGLWANIALVVNILLLLAILSLFQATLTLPGIAGIVLTIGMAVDANVIINERIKEELAGGRTPKAAIDSGYSHAMTAVIDGNITTLIAGIILYQFGTGPIKGFAVTLSIGIITTLFTAVIITRLIYDYRVAKGKSKTISI